MGFGAQYCQRHLPLQPPLTPAYCSPDIQHLTLNVPTTLPPTSGPLHMLASPPGTMVFLFCFIHSLFSSYPVCPQKSLSDSPGWHPHLHTVFMNISSSTRRSYSQVEFYNYLINSCLCPQSVCSVLAGRCQILLSMRSAAAVTGTGLVGCRQSISVG